MQDDTQPAQHNDRLTAALLAERGDHCYICWRRGHTEWNCQHYKERQRRQQRNQRTIICQIQEVPLSFRQYPLDIYPALEVNNPASTQQARTATDQPGQPIAPTLTPQQHLERQPVAATPGGEDKQDTPSPTRKDQQDTPSSSREDKQDTPSPTRKD